MTLPHFEGWHLIGAYPDGDIPGDVGSWLLMDDAEALLLEVPEGLTVRAVRAALRAIGSPKIRYATASHDHADHLDADAWATLETAFPRAEFIHPSGVQGDRLLHVGGEPLWLIKAPKHSRTDVVTVFRGVAMTGDIELGMLESVTDEVPLGTRRFSMFRLGQFEVRAGYKVHTIVSAHLNDVRQGVRWPDLFSFREAKPMRWQCRTYGCWGNLVPMDPERAARYGTAFDMICEKCGCPEWSDPRRK